jgi:hypothetical protein
MNTFFIDSKESFLDLMITEQVQILQELLEATLNDEYVSIRGQMVEEQNGERYSVLYGVYRLKYGELCDYITSGGVWGYEKPAQYINRFTTIHL